MISCGNFRDIGIRKPDNVFGEVPADRTHIQKPGVKPLAAGYVQIDVFALDGRKAYG